MILRNSTPLQRQAEVSLNIVIVGCGLGGLATAFCLGRAGHKVIVLEQASVLGEVGAGIQISPNVSRLFRKWGIGDDIERMGIRPGAFSFLRCMPVSIYSFDALAPSSRCFAQIIPENKSDGPPLGIRWSRTTGHNTIISTFVAPICGTPITLAKV